MEIQTYSARESGSTRRYAIPWYPSHNSGQPAQASSLASVRFGEDGTVVGTFADGTDRAIYKVPLAFFTNADGLETDNGMIFKETVNSGAATLDFADTREGTALQIGAVELSNVDISQEFSMMIKAQHAYNLNATTFRTVDEMTQVARDLKT